MGLRSKIKAKIRPKQVASKRQDEDQSRPQLPERETRAKAPFVSEDLWAKAEGRLKEDEKMRKILAASQTILETDFGLDIQPGSTIGLEGLCEFLDAKTHHLEERKWVIQLGGHSLQVRDQLTRVFRNVLTFKDIISTAASLSPPAAIACAGLTVVLQLLVQAAEQHETLLQGLEEISALIPLLRERECLYLQRDESQNKLFIENFQGVIVILYSKILEFQARALCYLQKHPVSQLLADMFKQNAWDGLLADTTRLENSIKSFTDIKRDTEIRIRLEQMHNTLKTVNAWQTTSPREEKIRKFLKLLYTCPYGDRKDRNSKRVPGTFESFSDLWSIFIYVTCTRDAGEVLCVFDALDECQDEDRTRLIEAVEKLYNGDRAQQNLKVLMTSRPYDHIRREFRALEDRFPTIHLSGEGEVEVEKISREIDLVIGERVRRIGHQNDLRQDECMYLEKQLTSESIENRTYLWVSLTLDVIERMPGFTKGNIHRAIHGVPKSVDDAYTRILDRSPDHDKAKTLLDIALAAERPLSLDELSVALAFGAERTKDIDINDEIYTDNERFQRTVRDLCGLMLVIIDTKVYLLHQTVKEFLVPNCPLRPDKWKHSLRPTDSHLVLARACASYLIYGIGWKYFIDYAARFWPSHFRKARLQGDHELATLGYALCQTEAAPYSFWSSIYIEDHRMLPENSTSIAIASALGIAAVVQLSFAAEPMNVDFKDADGRTPLSLAARDGHEAVVNLLLATGQVDVDFKDSDGTTPLSLAAERGHEAVVNLLLATGQVDVDSKDRWG
ncbi:hypothetical protein BO94DRAFT_629342 [Aspergillus sclerotioniger CBS 115572]|uniref:Uncharacterized protein n=1 Tax=Aspergillus sclerotioniger CBS 115572 TaxID=1450535 RepID=A0A317UUH2_9EURO|nr:hypothetical protein BO94DRAFT_629342 [Aspergillus sclerotioniger CBS 115572]PWY64728.1 hypothetical protein BO94DRAFT_629342 [Aspergillus sclerotioniger CBS 115572]